MSKLVKTLRTHWKKSLFGLSSLSYGAFYLLERKRNASLMQAYCYEALKYSRERLPAEADIKRVTVFLNPVANKERGKYVYDKNAAPLLHLSGLDIRLVRLEKTSEACEYMKHIDLNETDCIVVAGGNATLNEVIKGLVDRPDAKQFLARIPIGILPIGETNKFAKKWFASTSSSSSSNNNDSNFVHTKSDREKELRLFADAAMSILRGVSEPADLLKITIHQADGEPVELLDANNKKEAMNEYSVLKDNCMYALSNMSCGFVTITDANLHSYWYLGLGWLKNKMNRYFTDRYLRRNPFRYEFSYKLKCDGCSKCLNRVELLAALTSMEQEEAKRRQAASASSFLHRIFRHLFVTSSRASSSTSTSTTTSNEEESDKTATLRRLIDRSAVRNEQCGRVHTAQLKQVQIISNINEPCDELTSEHEMSSRRTVALHKHIDTVIVKDPQFNSNDMFLTMRKSLKEYELKKLNSAGLDKRSVPFVNYFAIEVDGEIYKLSNHAQHNLTIKVELIENCINLLKFDSHLAHNVKVEDYLPNVYLLSQRTLHEYLFNDDEGKRDGVKMPPIQPFEKFYVKYWKPWATKQTTTPENNSTDSASTNAVASS